MTAMKPTATLLGLSLLAVGERASASVSGMPGGSGGAG